MIFSNLLGSILTYDDIYFSLGVPGVTVAVVRPSIVMVNLIGKRVAHAMEVVIQGRHQLDY